MRNDKTAWASGRPVYGRLPEKGYQDNLIADSLTAWVDGRLSETKGTLEAWPLEVSPDTAKDSSLDYLGWLFGFSGSFWDTSWGPEVKRELIRLSHSFIWPMRGTLAVIRKVLDLHGISYDVWRPGVSTLPFAMPRIFGGGGLRFFVRLPITYIRGGQDWREAERTLRNYAPAVVETKVTYQRFYMGFSKIGDPMFSK